VLIGAELLGVIGALAAIPVGGSLQVIAREISLYRSRRPPAVEVPGPAPPAGL
jgi:predicted PurR-regulated permease PerM